VGDKRIQSPVAHCLARGDELYPGVLLARLGENAPAALTAIGPMALLANRKTALFCSARTPGDAILRAHDTARRLREEGVWYAVELQVYLDVGGDLIRSVDILCSGFVRESDGPEGPES